MVFSEQSVKAVEMSLMETSLPETNDNILAVLSVLSDTDETCFAVCGVCCEDEPNPDLVKDIVLKFVLLSFILFLSIWLCFAEVSSNKVGIENIS